MVGLPVDAVKIVIKGTMQAAQDWSTAIWAQVILESGAWGIDQQQIFATDIEAFVEDCVAAIKGEWSTTTVYTGISTYFYPAHSLTATQIAEAEPVSAIPGVTAAKLPDQCSACVSYRTDIAGRSGRGRGYWPATAVAVDTNGQMDNTTAGAFGANVADLMTALNGYSSSPSNVEGLTCIVASFRKPDAYPITHTICDSIVDTQRRREDKAGAEHTIITAVTPTP